MSDLTDLFPGAFASDGALPSDSGTLQNLNPDYGSALLSLPSSSPTMDLSSLDLSGALGGVSGGLSGGSGLASDLGGILGGSSSGGSSLGSILSPIVNTGLSALNALVLQPAAFQANQPQQQQQLANQLTTLEAQSQLSTNSFTTIILWGAIAYGLVLVFTGIAKKA